MSARIAAVLVVVLALLAGAWKSYVVGRNDGRAQVRQMWDQERAAEAASYANELARVRAREQSLQREADKDRQEKQREISQLIFQRDAALDGLHQRPERPADAASSAAALAQFGHGSQGCAGSQLYRPDADFLVREVARADLIRIRLAQCQARYQAAERAMNGE